MIDLYQVCIILAYILYNHRYEQYYFNILLIILYTVDLFGNINLWDTASNDGNDQRYEIVQTYSTYYYSYAMLVVIPGQDK